MIYTDLFRGIPTILLVLMLAFGVPALSLQGVPTSLFFWGLVALVLSYGAYVAEVIRAGIESIHPSQIASADALGLSRLQAMRYVVVPQGIRRVVPPLLNDFVSLQKDTALVGVAGRVRRDADGAGLRQLPLQLHRLHRRRRLLHRADGPAGPLHRPPAAPGDGAGEAGRAMTDFAVDGALMEVTDVRKTYGDKVVLRDIGLTVQPPRRRSA